MKQWLWIATLVLAAGCAAPDPRPLARDIVCLCKGDLGCVIVRIDETTPKADYNGQVFYFCAEGCRKEFLREPEWYFGEFLKRPKE